MHSTKWKKPVWKTCMLNDFSYINFWKGKIWRQQEDQWLPKVAEEKGGINKQSIKDLSVWFSQSVMSNSLWSWTAACQASLSSTNSRSLLKLMSVELVIPSNHLILCHPLLLLPSVFPSIRVPSSESVLCIRWPKYWSFSISISPSNEYSELISFRINWFDLLAVQRTLALKNKYSVWHHKDGLVIEHLSNLQYVQY